MKQPFTIDDSPFTVLTFDFCILTYKEETLTS